MNGRTKGDRMGNFTRFPLSIRESPSTLDYIATDISIMSKIKTFNILHHQGLSDHDCLLACFYTKGFIVPATEHTSVIKEQTFKYATSDEFLGKLRSPLGQEQLANCITQHSGANETTLEKMSMDLVDTLLPFSKAFASRKNRKRKRKRKNNASSIPWFSSEYQKLKSSLNRAMKDFKKQPFSSAHREKIFSLKKKFKQKCRV